MEIESRYNILINIKTPAGMTEIGSFFVGNEPAFAIDTFDELKGNNNFKELGILRIDLIKKNKCPPHECLKSIGCTLDEYLENCRIITRNAFKFFTMENNGFNNSFTGSV